MTGFDSVDHAVDCMYEDDCVIDIKVNKTGASTIIYHKIKKPEHIIPHEYEMVLKGSVPFFYPVLEERGFWGSKLLCKIDNYTDCASYLQGQIRFEQFDSLIEDLIQIVLFCDMNEIRLEKVDVRPEMIFYNPIERKVQLIYWPIEPYTEPASAMMLFRQLGAFYLEHVQEKDYYWAERYCMLFADGNTSDFDEFCRCMYLLHHDWDNYHRYNPNGDPGSPIDVCPGAYLKCCDTDEVIFINDENLPFSIGRHKDKNTFAIENDKYISRAHHIVITMENGSYSLTTESRKQSHEYLPSTKVQGKPLYQGDVHILQDMDQIDLGDIIRNKHQFIFMIKFAETEEHSLNIVNALDAYNRLQELEELLNKYSSLIEIELTDLPDMDELEYFHKSLNVGQLITFGKYPQLEASDAEPLKWRIVKQEEGCILLLAEKAIRTKMYHMQKSTVTWDTCELKQWLNATFFNEAFSDIERDMIIQMEQDDMENSCTETLGGDAPNDNVFLLSIQEAEDYLDVPLRKCDITDLAAEEGGMKLLPYGTCNWWLRSSGKNGEYAAYVDAQGNCVLDGCRVNYEHIAVRPAIWVRI